MTEYKSLRDLDVQPGDKVCLYDGPVRTVSNINNSIWCETEDGERWPWKYAVWSLVSRAEASQPYSGDEPIPLRDMTAEQIGLLVKAGFAGKKVEACNADGSFWFVVSTSRPQWLGCVAYRVRPGPTSVDLIADGRVVGTIEMEDGKINPTSAVWEDRG